MPSPSPVCTIIAGPNGAGKTTFALKFLPEVAGCKNFVNADLIAAGLSPLSPETEWLAAARLFLHEVRHYIKVRESFAFETTLAGRAYLQLIRQLRNDGWRVHLYYLWLPNVEYCLERVAERVAHGGHDIPGEIITRRYSRSVRNLLDLYAPECDFVVALDNSGKDVRLVFFRDRLGQTVADPLRFRAMENEVKP